MFLDEAQIHVASGRGGDGAVHFRREKYVPRGGPDGGDGGRGGDVILAVDPVLNTLALFRRKARFQAEAGGRGGSSSRTGRDAAAVPIRVPPGTLVRDRATGLLIADLVAPGQSLVVCRGGRGGRGNARFATSSNQAPRMAERGEPGEERDLLLELRLIADIGIVGVPNAGKSTLLAALTRAQPKIADYPFTTLEPNLGVEDFGDGRTLVLADIPGLIEGAHQGVGLGTGFLRHIQRTRALIHLVDGSADDPIADYSQVCGEMALFDPSLAQKPQIVAVNKIDLPEAAAHWDDVRRRFQALEVHPLSISAKAGTGLSALVSAAWAALERAPVPEMPKEMPVFRPQAEPGDFTVSQEPDGAWRVRGKALERAAEMTYWEHDEAVRRFQRTLVRLGVEKALRQAGVQEGDTVRIGDYELEWKD